MKKKSKFLKRIIGLDLFDIEPGLYYKGKARKPSLYGFIFKIIYIIIYLSFCIYKIIRLIKRVDVTFFEAVTFMGEIPSLKLNKEDFYGGLALGAPDTYEPFLDETIYFPKAYFKKGKRESNTWTWTTIPIELETCKIEKFGSKYKDIFNKKPLDKLYCIKEIDGTLEGHLHYETYSYIFIEMFPCINTTENNNHCKPLEIIDSYLNNTFILFYMQDVELNPTMYDNPVHARDKEVNIKLSRYLFKDIRAFFQIINVETDEDLIGFDTFAKTNVQKFLRFDSTTVFNYMHERSIYESGEPICDITLQLADQVLTHKRSYSKLITVLGDIGGLMEFFYSFIHIIASIISDIIYQKCLVSNLFEFDLDKKIIIIKKETKKEKQQNISHKKTTAVNDTLKNYSRLSSLKQLPLINSSQNEEITIFSKKHLNEEKNKINNTPLLINRNLKIVKNNNKLKIRSSFSSNLGKYESNELKKKNYIKQIRKKNENNYVGNNINIYYYDNNMKKEGNEIKNLEINEQRKIISRIKLNWCCVCSCFCCIRKKKNVQNILIDEGMKIIVEKLDVINLFKEVYRAEKDQKNYINNDEIIEMSDECKLNLKDIYNSLNGINYC